MTTEALRWSTEGCTIAASLQVVGDRQTWLVLREVFSGVRRFGDIHELTGIPRQVLSDRLGRLVDHDLLRRHTYTEPGQRARQEYRLTDQGFDLYPVVLALLEWGNKHAAGPDGPSVRFAHRDCGADVQLVPRCAAGHEIDEPRAIVPRPGPGARLRERAG